MKKLIALLTILFFLPTILAVNISMKTEFNSQETLIAKISGEFLEPLLDENIFFYRTHVRVPMDFDITKIQDDFYVYAILPQTDEQKNYSLRIKDIRYTQAGKSTDQEIQKDFSISIQTPDFNIEPGFIIASDDFTIQIKNLKDSEIEIKTQTEKSGIFSSLFGSGKQTITLEPSQTKDINFEIKDFESGSQTIELSTENSVYEIPIYLYISKQKPVKKDEPEQDKQTEEQEEKLTPQEIKDCFGEGGKFCLDTEECSGEFEYEDKGKCCLGTCEEKPKTPAWKILGYGIIILIIIIVYIFLTKYKGTKKGFNLMDIASGK